MKDDKVMQLMNQLWAGVEKGSGWCLQALWWAWRWMVWKPLWWGLQKAWEALLRTSDEVRRVVISFLVKAAMWLVLVMFALVFVQSGFSLGRTFSADGLQVLIRTFK